MLLLGGIARAGNARKTRLAGGPDLCSWSVSLSCQLDALGAAPAGQDAPVLSTPAPRPPGVEAPAGGSVQKSGGRPGRKE